jgi:hypothetical protein
MEKKISLPTITENIYLEDIQIYLEEEKEEKKEKDISLIKKTIEINSEKMVKIGIQTGQIINPERLIDLDTEKKRIELDASIELLQNIMQNGANEFKQKTGRNMTYSEMREMYG